MTLSNFDWTDKTSVRWFIMLPTGHEGPYDLISIKRSCQQRTYSLDVKIWTEGLNEPVTARTAFERSEAPAPKLDPVPVSSPAPKPEPGPEAEPAPVSMAHHLAAVMSEEEDTLPPLPEDDIPPLPVETYARSASQEKPESRNYTNFYLIAGAMVSGLVVFFLYQWIRGNENFSIRRQPKMGLDLHQRIENEFSFKAWDQKIFFKEYVPADLSVIWLVTSSFQKCDVEASFQSVKGKLLTMKDESISFRTTGVLSSHLVELSRFDFKSGTKIIPGLYELDVRATNCTWETMPAKLANVFRSPESDYLARMKVILYPKGPAEFNDVLGKLLKKKSDEEIKIQSREELFWDDLQQKLQTLLALSLQIEQHFLDFLDNDPKQFKQKLRPAVDHYTRKYGHFLTNFVVNNEAYFKQLGDMGARSKKRNYELMIKMTSKEIGLESMKLIEDLQKMKAPNKAQLAIFSARLKKTFADVKNQINQKIIQISDDRSI